MSDLKDIDWDDVIKKEARGSDDEDLGEVLETGHDYVLGQKRNDKQTEILYSKEYGRVI